jgi:subtilase family serine protease
LRYGADAATMRNVGNALRSEGFTIQRTGAQGFVVVAGAASLGRAFGARVTSVRAENGATRLAIAGALKIPAALRRYSPTILGLGGPSQWHADAVAAPRNRFSDVGPYWAADIREAYAFPSFLQVSGRGATIGIISDAQPAPGGVDLAAYFAGENFTAISGDAAPTAGQHYVLGGPPPFDPTSTDAEGVTVDEEQALGMAPGASALLYEVPELSDAGIAASYVNVVEDNVADVIESSFGNCELGYLAAYDGGTNQTGVLLAINDLFEQGNSQGQTFVAAAGNQAAYACYPYNSTPSVDFPASAPNVTAVGGTLLYTTLGTAPRPLVSEYVRETAFGDVNLGLGVASGTGSGTSAVFPRPLYQPAAQVPTSWRSVPDVSMQMGDARAPQDACTMVVFNGATNSTCAYGTGVSASEFAGLVALRVQSNGGRVGNANVALYELGVVNVNNRYYYFHTGIPGLNGLVTVQSGMVGYSPITGLGTPYGANLIGAGGFPITGDPETPSNP